VSAETAETEGPVATPSGGAASRAALGRQAIPGAHASGTSLDDDAEFDRLWAEIQKNPMHGAGPSWSDVVGIATQLLAERSKDLRVACYLCVALLHTEQLRGLRDGIEILLGLFEQHWETGHPALPSGRRARHLTLDYAVERATRFLRARTLDADDHAVLAECAERAAELAKLAEERLADDEREKALWGLAAVLRELAERSAALVPKPTPSRPTPRPTPTASTPATRTAPAAPPAATSPQTPLRASDVEIAARSDVPQLLLRCSEYLRAKQADSPLGYRIQRLARWGELEVEPPSRDRRSELRGPASEEITALRQLAESASWHPLLAASEDAFWAQPLWLDLQRWSHLALESLGSDHRQAALGIEEDVRALLQRLPGLARLCFDDGTPFADPATEHWIEEKIRPRSTPAPQPAAVGAESDPLEAALRGARAQAQSGDVAGAIRALECAIATRPSPRARFHGRLELAVLCAELGRDRIALALLEELDAHLQRHALETW